MEWGIDLERWDETGSCPPTKYFQVDQRATGERNDQIQYENILNLNRNFDQQRSTVILQKSYHVMITLHSWIQISPGRGSSMGNVRQHPNDDNDIDISGHQMAISKVNALFRNDDLIN
ncbi:predicted protein [Sclerotinia sclerotiorum 1980 UF-70]|uniref:Uncharacterized protein n=1 Tax=Sclerotinia sclerotiorum (strain ATCC 18683 / 1980 / Ss-1) TaxID=665079 RepID=A7ELD0_SCLS1|nr:predicted protein [Sclerotinia sclerotiorum 1980 UF-70]EDO03646.1 predicted protein [Sclerotinia sclerotiorum 1980 UF-70]